MLTSAVFCTLIFALTNAEPGGYSPGQNTAQSDVEIQQVEVIEIPWQETPQQDYGPAQSEYGPPKQEYGPPKQEYGPPKNREYGAPKQVYGPPKPVYGPPPEPTTTEADLTTTEYPTTTEVIPGNVTKSNNTRSGKVKKDDLTARGSYYIYHPNGALQRVVYATKDDVRNMVYSAQLKYQNVEPIKGPVYTYDPQSYVLQRINK
ncbi:hypothetical protein NQ317_007243 [Molorchus minor]|uniref:Uncharacterized protein n=1 Tax=Molorchus minor TaxID=1323400 RepID=A0ABQ9JWR6_9CUCU|nr:hypothetical protein NQ317_007243 [Molorchus minor]